MRGKGSARRRGSREHTAFCYGRDSGRTVRSEGSPGGAAAQEDNVGLWRCRGSAGARALVKGSESSVGESGEWRLPAVGGKDRRKQGTSPEKRCGSMTEWTPRPGAWAGA